MSQENLIIGIDAINIRAGGGITHLRELLNNADPSLDNFKKIVLWASTDTLKKIDDKPWIDKISISVNTFISRTLWQSLKLSKHAKYKNCDVLFIPGSSFVTSYRPIVTMNHNLLPFQFKEILKHGFSLQTLRLLALSYTQSRSFKRANGIIFLTKNAKDIVQKKLKGNSTMSKVIHHGINPEFFLKPSAAKDIRDYKIKAPFSIISVNAVEPYKHFRELIESIKLLKEKGYPISFEIFGGGHLPSIDRLKKNISKADPDSKFIYYRGKVPYSDLRNIYAKSDLFLYSSSCESFGQTLTEAMASGLPIATSNTSSAPELLQSSGSYFNPHDIQDISKTIKELLDSKNLRNSLSKSAYLRARNFSWYDCARETFKFINKVAKEHGHNAKK